ncbi:GtrA family protein [Desulfosediminicola flagellatus]|uniref:GtrA family protein n=1 Tax=Desulfosediminicola flagellatus TaxID=2569541 RepID=UPI0010AB6D06|nr:GtrA family protein [Desulfosediminicola flagellatus]
MAFFQRLRNTTCELSARCYSAIENPLLRFSIVGFLGTLLNLLVLALLIEVFQAPKIYASFVAIEISILHNFLLNNYWAFSSRTYEKSLLNRFIFFNLTSIVSLAVNLSIFAVLTRLELAYLAAQAIGILCAYSINYMVNSNFTFCNKAETHPHL